jgi:hypothetical protein
MVAEKRLQSFEDNAAKGHTLRRAHDAIERRAFCMLATSVALSCASKQRRVFIRNHGLGTQRTQMHLLACLGTCQHADLLKLDSVTCDLPDL